MHDVHLASTTSRPRTLRGALFGPLLAAGILAGCDGSSSGDAIATSPVQSVQTNPETGRLFIADPNRGGEASSVHLTDLFWGRLVNVMTSDGAEILRDFTVGRDIQTVPGKYRLETNPVTEEVTLTLVTVEADDTDSPTFYQDVIAPLTEFVTPIFEHDLDDVTTFSKTPRNAVLVLRFDDLMAPNTVNSDNIRVLTGYPPIVPFEARLFPDPNFGDFAEVNGQQKFFSTRVIIDPTVSSLEAEQTGLPVNSLGLPASITLSQPNLAIRIPTQKAPGLGQETLLANLTAHPLARTNNGPVETGTATVDVVRALRTGGNEVITGDANNGFLSDEEPPRILGNQTVVVQAVRDPHLPLIGGLPNPCFNPLAPEGTVAVDFAFAFPTCASKPKVGDVVRQNNAFGVVVTQSLPTPSVTGEIECLVLRLIEDASGDAPTFLPGVTGDYLTAYDPLQDVAISPCFVRFSPNAEDPSQPRIRTGAQVSVLFSEPMDPVSVTPFDSMTLTRSLPIELSNGSEGNLPEHYVVGQVIPSPDFREFSFLPSVPFFHQNGTSETYYLTLSQGDQGPTDLAGNALETALPRVPFGIRASEPTERTGGFALRFARVSEINDEVGSIFLPDPDGLPELRGQFLYDVPRRRLLPRPVTRKPGVADRTQAVPGRMTAFMAGVQTPLSPLGSKMQTLWRYYDVGWSLSDEENHNIDVEGLAWSPASGTVVADFYQEFEIRLSHTRWHPDETIDTGNLLPLYPTSGLVKTYAENLLENDLQRITHPRNRGYDVNPGLQFTATTGTRMMPFPMNLNQPVSEYRFYTWRDTAIQSLGGNEGSGADSDILVAVTGVGAGGVPYTQGAVPTIGLPLMMEYRCYPDQEGIGQNAFDISLAANSSARPNFRAFSTGGVNNSGQTVVKNPDQQDMATGGFNPGSTPPGNPTQGIDNSFYIGQMDTVVRVSRVHTVWFPASDPQGSQIQEPSYATPVVQPSPEALPLGTAITLAFRGALVVAAEQQTDAGNIGWYGGPHPLVTSPGTPPVFVNGDATWKSAMTDLTGARFFQARISFLSNAETGLTAELQALGFAYQE